MDKPSNNPEFQIKPIELQKGHMYLVEFKNFASQRVYDIYKEALKELGDEYGVTFVLMFPGLTTSNLITVSPQKLLDLLKQI